MRALKCHGSGVVSVVGAPDPRLKDDDVLVRIHASAICGSENGSFAEGAEFNRGHEAAGRVLDPGSSSFAIGDPVGLAAVIGCGACDRCLAGRELHCRHQPRLAVGSGWHAELAAVPARAVRLLPDGASVATGALLTGDALGVPGRAFRRFPSGAGDRVLILGLGPVGLGHLVVRAFHGAEVTAVEPSAYRRDLGLRLGARAVLNPGEDIGFQPSLVLECTGRPECISAALAVVEPGGVVIQSGECTTQVPISPSTTFIRREVLYTGSWYYSSEDYPSMVEAVARGINIDGMCTHDVSAEDAQDAISSFLAGEAGKVLLRWT